MRILSWNTAGRPSRVGQQVEAIGQRKVNVVCLQEVRRSTRDGLRDGLRAFGLIHAVDSLSLLGDAGLTKASRQTGEFIASRWPLRKLNCADVPWPEKTLSVVVESPTAEVEVHTVHVPPGSSNGWTKIHTFNGIFRHLAHATAIARILCGDFNSPQRETADENEKVKHFRLHGEPPVTRFCIILKTAVRGFALRDK